MILLRIPATGIPCICLGDELLGVVPDNNQEKNKNKNQDVLVWPNYTAVGRPAGRERETSTRLIIFRLDDY